MAYHVDPPVAVERIQWYRDALPKFGRKVADHEVCCVYHAHFLEQGDDDRLRDIVDGPMGEYAVAGVEATSKPPDPTAYKGYDRREAAQRNFGFNDYFPGRVLMGGPDQVVDRIHQMKEAGITQVSMLVDFGSLDQAEIMRSLNIFARDILPRVRDI